jgi:hypothetical protein
VQEVALVLAPVEALEQLEAAAALAHARVVAGRDLLGAEPHRVVEEGLELDLGVAQHVRVGRAAGRYSRRNSAKTRSLYSAAKLTCSISMPMHVGDAGGVEEVLARRAVLVVVVLLPVLHEDADDLVAGALQQPGGHGRIDAAGQADDDALLAGEGRRPWGLGIVAAAPPPCR